MVVQILEQRQNSRQRNWRMTVIIVCSHFVQVLQQHLHCQQQQWRTIVIIVCFKAAQALYLHHLFRQQHLSANDVAGRQYFPSDIGKILNKSASVTFVPANKRLRPPLARTVILLKSICEQSGNTFVLECISA